MTSVFEQFQALRDRQQCALIPFVTAGDPDLETTATALRSLDKCGADLIELGVPYSDPLADGPVIQAAATRALQKGTTLDDVLNLVKIVSPDIAAPIILFTYYNPILNRGIDTFFQDIAAAGAKGLVVPDLPLEEVAAVTEAAEKYGIEVILLVAPTSPKERIEAIAQQSRGFIYLVSVTGVTGIRSEIQSRVKELLEELKAITDKPVAVGFGVSQPEQAEQLRSWGADGVVVGSAFVKRLANSDGPDAGINALENFCTQLNQAIKP
ncbi:tryptophan synthase subunit alpha [Oscillatoria sp. CS-180]|uniref:tryptophan synthase subunit alpha n=1 Tax=Oscillatoria sp. CS-180 TaxID=3021720 RepID=UPI00232D6B35|nr:tryptophan synthase subunit alpha [Oscillatoria sp. CS-180]MDB9525996.1 tryptophan synthase subunit alpha [Oscillatoria sp. CS-180]